jgi:NADPH2:quinone reductase
MRAIQVAENGGPDVLKLVELPDPVPGDGELVVRTEAIGVNFIDTYFRTGAYPKPLPYIPGQEGVGIVESSGPGSGFAPGERVAWAESTGSYSELVVVPAAHAVPVPADLPAEQAASALLQGMTAHYLINSVYPVTTGDTILMHAGAGGVGLILTQLAVAKGARVIATVSNDTKAELSREAGAFAVLRYHDDIPARVRELTGGDGVAVVYDGVGKDTWEASLKSVRVRGMVALFGAASGKVDPIDPQRLNALGSVFLTRPKLGDYTRNRDELLWRAGDVLNAIVEGTLEIRVGATYPLTQAAQAHRDLEGRKTTGSIVLVP